MNKIICLFIVLLTLCCFTKNSYSGNIHKQWALNLDVAAKTADTSGHIWCLTKTGYLYSIRKNGTIRDSVFVHSINSSTYFSEALISESGYCYSAIQYGDNVYIQKTDTNGLVIWNKMIHLTVGVDFCYKINLSIVASKLFFHGLSFAPLTPNGEVASTFSLDLYSGATVWRYDEYASSQLLSGSLFDSYCYNSTNYLFIETNYTNTTQGEIYNSHVIKFDRLTGARLDSFTILNYPNPINIKILGSFLLFNDINTFTIRDENFNLLSNVYAPYLYSNDLNNKGNLVTAFNETNSAAIPNRIFLKEYSPITGAVLKSDSLPFFDYGGGDFCALPNGNYFLPLAQFGTVGQSNQTLNLLLDSNFTIIDSCSFRGNLYPGEARKNYWKYIDVINPHQFVALSQEEVCDTSGNFTGFTNYLTLIEDSIGITQYANKVKPANTITAVPNPANGNFQVVFNAAAAGSYQLSINSLTGQTMVANKINCSSPGYYYYNFNSSAYPNGLYLVNIGQGAKSASAKLMVVNH